jgi:OFA family oxalate/formate antiporter-like MFS transporter
MLFIPLIADILKTSGYKEAFLYTGIGQGLVILVAAQVLQNPGPDFKVSPAAKKPVSPKLRRNTAQFTSLQMMSTPQFWLMYVAFVLTSVGGLMITAQAAPVARGMAIPAAAIVMALAWSRGANGAGRIFWGWLSDYVGREMAMVIPFALQAGCIVAVLTLGRLSGAWFIATMIAIYFTWGSMFSLFPAIVGDYFGADHATSNYGFLYTAKGVASIGGGWIAAKLFEKFGNWNADFYGTAALALVSAFMILALKAMPLPKRAEMESEMVLAKTGT